MALEKSINLSNYGLQLPNSYHKIESILIRGGRIEFGIEVYASKEARDSGSQPLSYTPDSVDFKQLYQHHAGDDIIAKLYNYVKTVNTMYQTDTSDV